MCTLLYCVAFADEPTNHLDMEAIRALADALNGFSGGVLIISHDQYFIKQVCKQIWVVKNHTIKSFEGTFDDYKKIQLASLITKA